jgi:hypothetical protein
VYVEYIRIKRLSPAAKLALKSLVLGVAKNNKEAAVVSGLHPAYVGILKNTDVGKEFMSQGESKMDEKLLETSQLMDLLGREALMKMGGLMRFSGDENIILRASADLMDRAPATQKVQKHRVESFTISSSDAKEIARAMVESARERERFDSAARGDFVKIEDQKTIGPGDKDAAA